MNLVEDLQFLGNWEIWQVPIYCSANLRKFAIKLRSIESIGPRSWFKTSSGKMEVWKKKMLTKMYRHVLHPTKTSGCTMIKQFV